MVALEQRGVLDQFLGVFDWYLGRIHDAVCVRRQVVLTFADFH